MVWPLLIPLITAGIGAATSIYSAKKQSDAAKGAASTQSGSIDKALGVLEAANADSQEALAPGPAYTTLGSLMGLPTRTGLSSTPGAPSRTQSSLDALHTYNPLTGQGLLDGYVYRDPQTGYLQPTPWAVSQGKGFSYEGVPPQTQSAYATGGNEVTRQMRAPDGSLQDIPISQVPHYLALGATIVRG